MTRRRSALPPQRFERHGLLALDPRAFFELFIAPASRANELRDNVAIVEVSGPLVQRDELWCDSYEAIRARFEEALASEARAIILRLDSPGGDASGCFETARALRQLSRASKKPFVAYVDKACSAAYALASSADYIVIGETCCAGSIGVLSSRPDYTAQNAQRGVRIAFTTSGARKLDGNPDTPITEAELAETQRHVDDLALKFYALISDMRPQLSAAAVAGFDGGVFYGNGAVEAQLADAVATFDEALALVSEAPMSLGLLQAKSEYDVARQALEKVAKGTDANAKAARRALASLAEDGAGDDEEETEEPSSEEPDGDEPKPDAAGDPPAPAAGDEPPDEDPAKKKPAAAAAPAAAPAAVAPAAAPAATQASATGDVNLDLAARLHKLEAREAARDARSERSALLATRPDFGPELKAALSKAPIETVRDMVKTLPRKPKKQAITTLPAARGSTTTPAGMLSSVETADMDRRMGLTEQRVGCKREGSALIFGVVSDEVPQPSAAAGKDKAAS